MKAYLKIIIFTLSILCVMPFAKVEGQNKNPELIYSDQEQLPQFPGGDGALMKYISSNIIYPPNAKAKGIEGRVIVQFVVKENGKIGKIKIARGVNPELDKEAVRIVRLLPAFTPGKLNGKIVSCWYTIPVNFKLKKTN